MKDRVFSFILGYCIGWPIGFIFGFIFNYEFYKPKTNYPCFATQERIPGVVYPLGYFLHCNPDRPVWDSLVKP